MKNSKIAFIGAGKMAEAIIKGIFENKTFPNGNIVISDKQSKRVKYLNSFFGVKPAQHNSSAVAFANVVILAVKPQDMGDVLEEIKPYLTRFQLVISIAAGITLEFLQKKLKKVAVIRAMPNNAALVGAAITALAPGNLVKENHLKTASEIFGSVGQIIHVPEKYMDAITALSGSGPAFVYLFLDSLIKGGIKAKLPAQTAARLAMQTFFGAVKTADTANKPLKELIKMVASRGGTTEAGLKVLKKYKVEQAVINAILAASKRSKELSRY